MPWKETRTVDQRLQFLSSYQKEEMSVTDLCHEYGISRPTAYKWIKRYDEVGPEGCLIARARHIVVLMPHRLRSKTRSLRCGSDSRPGEPGNSKHGWSV